MSLLANYSYIRSTSERLTDVLATNSLGKQLRYVPLHKANMMLIIKDHDFTFKLNKSYVSDVITNHGASEDRRLEGFILTDLSIIYDASVFIAEGKIKNLMNLIY